MPVKLIADSGSTKCEWCLLANGKKKKIFTTGMSPYFLSAEQMVELLQKELVKKLQDVSIDEILKPAYLLIPAADKDFYAVLYQSVWKYLGSYFHLQGSEMNKYTLVKKMLDAGKSPELINNLHQVLEHCEAGMFTNATLEEDKEALLVKVKKLLEEVKAN